MEQATLRPVPLRPSGPVDPADALAHVVSALPELDGPAARALSLVEIAGRTREQAGEETGLAGDDLAQALYRARKALRRSIFPLSASGWCERAERLLSDRIDGVLQHPGPARLDVHLRNCERCVDHERRLSTAREKLVREFLAAHPESAAGPAERARVAALRVVEPAVVEEPEPEVWTGPVRIVPGFDGPRIEPLRDGDDEPPHASFAGPGGQTEFAVEPRSAETPPDEEPPDESPPAPPPDEPPVEQTIAPAEPADATPSERDAETADPLVPVEEPEAPIEPKTSASTVWLALYGLSIGLALFAVIVLVLALAGVHRVL